MIDQLSLKPSFKFVKGDIVRFSFGDAENKITGEVVAIVATGKKQQFYSVKTSDGVTHKIAQSNLIWLPN